MIFFLKYLKSVKGPSHNTRNHIHDWDVSYETYWIHQCFYAHAVKDDVHSFGNKVAHL